MNLTKSEQLELYELTARAHKQISFGCVILNGLNEDDAKRAFELMNIIEKED